MVGCKGKQGNLYTVARYRTGGWSDQWEWGTVGGGTGWVGECGGGRYEGECQVAVVLLRGVCLSHFSLSMVEEASRRY
jgi:hypothetical protein